MSDNKGTESINEIADQEVEKQEKLDSMDFERDNREKQKRIDELEFELINQKDKTIKLEFLVEELRYENREITRNYSNCSRLLRKVINVQKSTQHVLEIMLPSLLKRRKTLPFHKLGEEIRKLKEVDYKRCLDKKVKACEAYSSIKELEISNLVEKYDSILDMLNREEKEKKEDKPEINQETKPIEDPNGMEFEEEEEENQLNSIEPEPTEISFGLSVVSDMSTTVQENKVESEINNYTEFIIKNVVNHQKNNPELFDTELKSLDESLINSFVFLFNKLFEAENKEDEALRKNQLHTPMGFKSDIGKNINRFVAEPKSDYNKKDGLNSPNNIEKLYTDNDILVTDQSLQTSMIDENIDKLKANLSAFLKLKIEESIKRIGESYTNSFLCQENKEEIERQISGLFEEEAERYKRFIEQNNEDMLGCLKETVQEVKESKYNSNSVAEYIEGLKQKFITESVALSQKEDVCQIQSDIDEKMQELVDQVINKKEFEIGARLMKLELERLENEIQAIQKDKANDTAVFSELADRLKEYQNQYDDMGISFEIPEEEEISLVSFNSHIEKIKKELRATERSILKDNLRIELEIESIEEGIRNYKESLASTLKEQEELKDKLDKIRIQYNSLADNLSVNDRADPSQSQSKISNINNSNQNNQETSLMDQTQNNFENSQVNHIKYIHNSIESIINEKENEIVFIDFIESLLACLSSEYNAIEREEVENSLIYAISGVMKENERFKDIQIAQKLETEESLSKKTPIMSQNNVSINDMENEVSYFEEHFVEVTKKLQLIYEQNEMILKKDNLKQSEYVYENDHTDNKMVRLYHKLSGLLIRVLELLTGPVLTLIATNTKSNHKDIKFYLRNFWKQYRMSIDTMKPDNSLNHAQMFEELDSCVRNDIALWDALLSYLFINLNKQTQKSK